MSNYFYGLNKGQEYQGDYQLTSGTATGNTDVELRVTTTNVGLPAGLSTLDVILLVKQLLRYLESAGGQLPIDQIGPIAPGQD